MKTCSRCGAKNDDRIWNCDQCGNSDFESATAPLAGPLATRPSSRPKWLFAALAGAAAIAAMFIVAASSGSGAPARAVDTYRPNLAARVSGDSPVATALKLSRDGWVSSDAAVIVSADDGAAAAVAGPVAARVGSPVLLSTGDVPQAVLDELTRLKADRVYLLGRSSAFSISARSRLTAGRQIIDLTGADDLASSGRAAEFLTRDGSGSREAYVVPAADAGTAGLAVSMLAATRKAPLLLSDDSGSVRIDSAVLASMKLDYVFCAQKRGSAEPAFAGAIVETMTIESHTAFAARFGDYAFRQGLEYSNVFVAREGDASHAYALAAFNARTGMKAPVVFADENALGTPAESFLASHASAIKQLRFVGPGGSATGAVERAALEAAATKIYRNAVVVTTETASAISLVTTDAITFARDPGFTAGRVLVGGVSTAAPKGFVRRVTAVERRGRQIVVKTEPATLEDVIQKGSLEFRFVASADQTATTQLTDRSGVGQGTVRQAVWRSSRVLPSSEQGGLLVPVGYVDASIKLLDIPYKKELSATATYKDDPASKDSAKASFSLGTEGRFSLVVIGRMRWGFGGIEHAEIINRFTHENKLSAKAEVSASIKSKAQGPVQRVPLSPKSLRFRLGVSTGAIPVGPIPVPITASTYFEATAQAKLLGGIATESSDKIEYEMGFSWDRNSSPQSKVIDRVIYKRHEETQKVYGSASFHGFVGLRQDIEIADCVGPYMRAGIYGDVSVTAERASASGGAPGASSWTGTAEAGLEGALGCKAGILGVEFEVEATPVKYPLYSQSIGGTTATDEAGTVLFMDNSGVWSIDVQSMQRKRLAAMTNHAYKAYWTPDRRFVVAIGRGTHYDADMWVVDARSGRTLLSDPDGTYMMMFAPRWSSDYSQVLTMETPAIVTLSTGVIGPSSFTETDGREMADNEGTALGGDALDALAAKAAASVGLPDRENTAPGPYSQSTDNSRAAWVSQARYNHAGYGLLNVVIQDAVIDEHGTRKYMVFQASPSGELRKIADNAYGAEWAAP